MRNRFDYILIGLLTLMAFGSIGGFWQPVRVAELILLPWMAYDLWRTRPCITTTAKWIGGFFAGWWLWAAVSLIWACDLTASAKYVVHLAIYMMSFAEILWLGHRAKKPLQSLTIGWLLAAMLTVPLALREFITDHHLPTSVRQCLYVRVTDTDIIPRPFAAGTFDNINAYNVLLGCTFAMLMLALMRSHRWRTAGYGLACIFIIVILLCNGSRGALLAVIIGLVALTLLARRWTGRTIGGALLFLVGLWIGLGLSGHHVPSFLDAWSEETRQEWRIKMDMDWDGDATSPLAGRLNNNGLQDPSRMDLWKACGEEIIASRFLGVGAANYVCALEKHPESLYKAPHNMWLETLMQFGIVIFIGFVAFLVWPLWRCRRDRTQRTDCLTLFLILLPMTIVDSTFLLKAHTWVLFATLYLITNANANANDRVVD